jgi:hypothetical protein
MAMFHTATLSYLAFVALLSHCIIRQDTKPSIFTTNNDAVRIRLLERIIVVNVMTSKAAVLFVDMARLFQDTFF